MLLSSSSLLLLVLVMLLLSLLLLLLLLVPALAPLPAEPLAPRRPASTKRDRNSCANRWPQPRMKTFVTRGETRSSLAEPQVSFRSLSSQELMMMAACNASNRKVNVASFAPGPYMETLCNLMQATQFQETTRIRAPGVVLLVFTPHF